MKILHPFLALTGLAQRAVAHAHKIVERWDVPHEVEVDGKLVPVPKDLDDHTPRMWGLADGRRITSVLTLDELGTGGPNPAAPLLLALIPLAAILAFLTPPSLHHIFDLIAALAFGVGVVFSWRAVGFKLTAVAAMLSSLSLYRVMFAHAAPATQAVSFGGIAVQATPLPVAGIIASPMFPMFLLFIALGGILQIFLILAIYNWLFGEKQDAKKGDIPKRSGIVHAGRSALTLGSVTIATVVVAMILSHVSPFLATIAICTPMVIFPAWYARRERTAYHRQLAAMDIFFPGESLNQQKSHIGARLKQAISAAADRTPFLTLGLALGSLTKNLDGYAPDAGMPVGLTINDLSQHLLVIGTSGTGKTSGVLRPLIKQYVDSKAGGLLVLDGKGSLAAEMKGLPGYTVIDPSVDLGLIEGLEPADVVRALVSVGAHFGNSGAQNPFFISEGSTMVFHLAVILKALIEARIDGYQWTLHDLHNLLVNLNADPRKEGERLGGLVGNLSPASEGDSILLADAATYVLSTIVGMDSRNRSNIWATVQSWMSPIFQHPELVKWSHTAHGIDISQIDTGGLFGVSLPEVRYGKAGALANSLIKERVFNILRRRVTDPKPDQTKIAIVVDEAQELVGAADKAFLPIARSLGGLAIYASQTIDAFHARIGNDNEARAFLDTFSSQVILRSSKASIDWIATRLGTTMRPSWKANGASIGFVQSLDALATASLSSTVHEGSSLYRSLRRQGSGQFQYSGLYGRDFGHLDHMHIPAMTSVEFQAMPLITPEEADQKLAEPFVAIVQVQRGGVRRRDFVQLAPMFDFSPAAKAA